MKKNENSIYKIFMKYSEKDENEKEFQDEIINQLQSFKNEEEKREETIENKKEITENNKNGISLQEKKKTMPFWAEFFLNIFILTLLFIIVRSFIFVPFNIDGQSMEGNLHNGEFIYVDKATPYFRNYERGDIVVFIPPYEKLVQEKGALCLYHSIKNKILQQKKPDPCLVQASFVKRVIGIEGDVIEIKGGHVYITPKGGKQQESSQDFLLPQNQNKTCLPAQNCQSKTSIEGKIFEPVPTGKVFVLGDNRTGSSDSREQSWKNPFVEEENIVGIARAVFLSPPPVEERTSGFLGNIKTLFLSFSGDRILYQKLIIEE